MLPRQSRAKRAVDLVAAIGGLGLLALPMGVLAGVVRMLMGRPVLFRQERIGLSANIFTLYKFRTMTEGGPTSVAADAERITGLGSFLRRTSLDELPTLFNVAKGNMSLVGPRPLLVQYLDRYSSEQMRRHEVRPGITGWAQVNGRNALTWEQKFELDVWYVDNWSLQLDLKILWMTAVQVVKGSAISAEGHATMPEFMGRPGGDQQ